MLEKAALSCRHWPTESVQLAPQTRQWYQDEKRANEASNAAHTPGIQQAKSLKPLYMDFFEGMKVMGVPRKHPEFDHFRIETREGSTIFGNPFMMMPFC